MELARQTKKDESSASILILGGKIHRGLCGVRADTEHVLLRSEKEQEKEREALNVREYMKRFFKKAPLYGCC